jgi:hypothetical protein
MMALVTFDWPGQSWDEIRSVSKAEFATRYGVPERVVATLFRKRMTHAEPMPVKWRLGPASEIDKIEANLEVFVSPAPKKGWKPSRRARRVQQRIKLRRDRKARAVREEQKRAKAVVYYACRSKHHEHCKGTVVGRPKCTCRCHQPRHRERFKEKERAWFRGHPPALPRRKGRADRWRLKPEPAKPTPTPTTTVGILQANRDWKQAEQDKVVVRDRGAPPSLAGHALSEEDVEAVYDFYNKVVYGYGKSLDTRIEERGDRAVRAFERMPKCTDLRARPDPDAKKKPLDRRGQKPRGYNKKTPEQQRAYMRDRYRSRRILGHCGHCGAEDLAGGTEATCARCLAKDRDRTRRYAAKRREARELRAVRGRMAAALSSVSRRLVGAVRSWDQGAWE